jgi:hypothetical protein
MVPQKKERVQGCLASYNGDRCIEEQVDSIANQ